MSGRHMEWAIRAARDAKWVDDAGALHRLDPADRLVLLALAHYANPATGEAWPSRRKIADLAELGHWRITTALHRLELTSLITALRQPGQPTRWIFPTLVNPTRATRVNPTRVTTTRVNPTRVTTTRVNPTRDPCESHTGPARGSAREQVKEQEKEQGEPARLNTGGLADRLAQFRQRFDGGNP